MVRIARAFGMALAAVMGLSAGLAVGGASANPTLVMDLQTGKVLHDEEATRPWYPASLSKLMTAYTVFKAIQAGRLDLGTPVAISKRAARMAPSKMGYPVGTLVTIDDALKMLIVQSANDIAVALAEGTSGSVEAFAGEMNANAQALGMTQSHWVNPNGLPDPGQISSARDMALVASAILREFPQYAPLFRIEVIQSGDRMMRTHNALLYRYPGAEGMKTGFICAAGFNVVAIAQRGGRRLLTVIMGAPSEKVRTQTAADLFEGNYDNSGTGFFSPGKTLGQLAPSPYVSPPDIRAIACNRKKAAAASEEEADAAPAAPATPDKPGNVLSMLQAAPAVAAPASPLLTSWVLDQPVVVGPYIGPRQAANAIPAADLVADASDTPVRGKKRKKGATAIGYAEATPAKRDGSPVIKKGKGGKTLVSLTSDPLPAKPTKTKIKAKPKSAAADPVPTPPKKKKKPVTPEG